MKYRHLANSWL